MPPPCASNLQVHAISECEDETNLGLVLPGNAAEPGVELQMLPGSHVIEKGVKLRAVADALLHTQEVLQDAAHTQETLCQARCRP